MKKDISPRGAPLVLAFASSILSIPLWAGHQQLEYVDVRATSLSSQGLALDEENTAGSRLGLSAQDIPASVSVISKEAIALRGDDSSMMAVTRAAGFSSSASPGNGSSATSVRGFNGHSSVVSTYDGTRLYVGSGTVSFPADTWTVERIEVLRDPGSVIHGVGAVGATVNYVSKKPQFGETRNSLAVTLGSFGLQRYAYGAGGELSPELAYRVDLVHHQTDGYVDRADAERQAIAGSLLYRPSEDFSATLSIDYANTESAPYWGTPLVDGKIRGSLRRNNYNVADGLVEYEDLWPRLHTEWQLSESLTWRSDTYYLTAERHWRNVESYGYNDTSGQVDRSSYLEILHEQEQLGHRSDLLWKTGMAGMQNRLNIGIELNDIRFSHINNSPYTGNSSVDLNNPAPGRWQDNVGSATTRDFDSETDVTSLFIDNVLEITPEWLLVAGLRHDRIDYSRDDLARSNGQPESHIDDELSGNSWRLGAVFKASEATSLYLQYSKAVDAIQSLLSASNPSLDLAEGTQWEGGIKQNLLNERLQVSLAVYDIVKTDLLSSDPGGVQRQIGEQSSRGVELELFWLPLDVVSVDFNLAITDPQYEEYRSGTNDYSGKTPRNVPEKTANLWVSWQFLPHWTASLGSRYVSERYADYANTSKLPDYVVYDASLQWQLSDDLRLSLRGKNLSDTADYVLTPYGEQWILADGRSAELELRYDF